MSHPDSPAHQIRVVTVIGAGFLGRQIAAMCAASGRDVRLHDVDPNAAREAATALRAYLADPVATGALDWDLDAVLARVEPVDRLEDSMGDTDLMIEAVHEDLDTKREVFRAASAANVHAFLATNSSSIMSAALRDVVSQTDRLVNLHFFSEFWTRSMVELMGCGETSEATIDTLYRFGQSLGLFCAVVRGQSKGFIINRVWRAVKREALRVVDEGHADPEDVDRLWAHFWGIAYGPFAMMDTVGLDVVSDIEDTYIAVSSDPTDRPSRTLRDLVSDGHLGVKSGEGFYRYPNPAFRTPGWPRTGLADET
jgi:3-hydroxybutyryl-CoA dehydrogenase